MAKGTEIATVDKFEITNINDDIKAVIVEEMDGLGTIPFEIVKMPSGGRASLLHRCISTTMTARRAPETSITRFRCSLRLNA